MATVTDYRRRPWTSPTAGVRYPIFMTDVFDELTDEQFLREWVSELLDQLATCDEEKMPLADLARMLTDVRSRYNSILKRTKTKGTTHMNALQVRIIRRCSGMVTHPFLSEIFGISTPQIALLLLKRIYKGMSAETRSRRSRRDLAKKRAMIESLATDRPIRSKNRESDNGKARPQAQSKAAPEAETPLEAQEKG